MFGLQTTINYYCSFSKNKAMKIKLLNWHMVTLEPDRFIDWSI